MCGKDKVKEPLAHRLGREYSDIEQTPELLYSWACLLMLVVYGINIGYNIEYQNIK